MQIVLICEYDDENLAQLEALSERYAGNHITPESIQEQGLDYYSATDFFKLINTGQFDPTQFWCINCDLWM
ncbi:hypothetical protein [Photobacterium leiognathi]|uniref:hypothetical protein n=1 Tax=Photobacterium leiognathi TaxID=553611 RepID=UPI00298282CD|nr:hypothetical protein [Photobacterium leiognathi]